MATTKKATAKKAAVAKTTAAKTAKAAPKKEAVKKATIISGKDTTARKIEAPKQKFNKVDIKAKTESAGYPKAGVPSVMPSVNVKEK